MTPTPLKAGEVAKIPAYQKYNETHKKEQMARNRKIRERNKRLKYEYLLTKACVDCENTDPLVLGFDHVRGEKKADIARLMVGCWAWSTILAEIAKCDVVCANCHAKRTAMRRGDYKYLIHTGQISASASSSSAPTS